MNLSNYNKVISQLPDGVTLVAVSKTKPIEDVLTLYHAGQKIFGENKVQELVSKYERLPKDILWHMIGHLQTNKVKYIIPFVSLVHSIDSIKLLEEINRQAIRNNRIIDCLLQVHIAEEENKFGFSFNEVKDLAKTNTDLLYKGIRICGLMGMASFTENESQISHEFESLKTLFDELKASYYKENDSFAVLSMGMSSDYKIAIKHGSNMVRIGSTIFGLR